MSDSLTAPADNLASPEVFRQRQQSLALAAEWFVERQQEAWQRYLTLPWPTRVQEKWRFANLKAVQDIERFAPAPFAVPEADELVARSNVLSETAGRLIFVDDNIAAPIELKPELAQQGVIFTPLIDALNRYPELVQKYFMAQTPELGSEKFENLHVAMLRAGVFLYVPKGVEIKEPFAVYHWTKQDGTAIFPHTIVVCEDNASGTLVEFQNGAAADTEHLVIANAHLYAGNGAKPQHRIIQNWNERTLSFQLNTSNAQRDVESKQVIINVGSKQARQEIHGKIFGSGSNVELYSLGVPRGEQEFDQRTLQTHIAPNSRSDLLYKNALSDDTRTIFSGLIIVEEGAQQTDAYQTNNNLMLSDKAEANSLPGLEIGANDVKCSHGATSGRIDDSEIFYFLARGIPRNKAQELMVFGFCEEILEKFNNQELATFVRDLVTAKFTA
ncbi:MAG: Fe-S cluster assembly protein SufD [Verrucomicrobiota bacterium JB022]|nr:Fe-S cluster assembly protein SufD [Verrucomicrobiota bacterium JB022]